MLIDGMAKKVFSCREGVFDEISENEGFEGIPSPRLIAHHCPECGEDLPAGGDAVVFQCHNCERGWMLDQTGLTRAEISSVKSEDKDVKYYPFWRFEAIFNGK